MMLEERGLPGGPVWYFPAGALEAGETLSAAVRRETREETGYAVEPLRVVRIDHGVFPAAPELFWWRYVVVARLLTGEPDGQPEPGVVAIDWVPRSDISGRRLRADDASELAARACDGGGLDVDALVLSPDGTLDGFIA
jgi:ADP-ribose pyrophosphatase YjhB (NUDIX family)